MIQSCNFLIPFFFYIYSKCWTKQWIAGCVIHCKTVHGCGIMPLLYCSMSTENKNSVKKCLCCGCIMQSLCKKAWSANKLCSHQKEKQFISLHWFSICASVPLCHLCHLANNREIPETCCVVGCTKRVKNQNVCDLLLQWNGSRLGIPTRHMLAMITVNNGKINSNTLIIYLIFKVVKLLGLFLCFMTSIIFFLYQLYCHCSKAGAAIRLAAAFYVSHLPLHDNYTWSQIPSNTHRGANYPQQF